MSSDYFSKNKIHHRLQQISSETLMVSYTNINHLLLFPLNSLTCSSAIQQLHPQCLLYQEQSARQELDLQFNKEVVTE